VLRRLGAVQLDTISVLARSHELVPYARLGAVGRDAVERAFWGPAEPTAFEYWAHAACVIPLDAWPYFSARRRGIRAQGKRWHSVSERTRDEVLARLRADGPLTSTQLGGAKNGGPWWDWSEVKIAAEWLLDTGDAVCVRRVGWRRVYDLPERVIPGPLLAADPADAECLAYLVGIAGRSLGVATHADLTDYHRLNGSGLRVGTPQLLDEAAVAAGLVPVTIAGGNNAHSGGAGNGIRGGTPGRAERPAGRALRGWADTEALAWLDAGGRGTHRTTLLSPFDPLVWDRKRSLRMFGFEHSLEAYVPREKRVHGYFAMPLLAGGRLVGRVDPSRSGKTLVAKQVTLEAPSAVAPMARALTEAASWVNCDNVAIDRVEPASLMLPLSRALT
jgi:hypothetical protein